MKMVRFLALVARIDEVVQELQFHTERIREYREIRASGKDALSEVEADGLIAYHKAEAANRRRTLRRLAKKLVNS